MRQRRDEKKEPTHKYCKKYFDIQKKKRKKRLKSENLGESIMSGQKKNIIKH